MGFFYETKILNKSTLRSEINGVLAEINNGSGWKFEVFLFTLCLTMLQGIHFWLLVLIADAINESCMWKDILNVKIYILNWRGG